ncbi:MULTISPECIES: YtxH domain-containing protein [unclassified Bacillus (in: firmicutes)]|uniref:YtxH domain-containing protein n=1 Tax=unclassified Bacillus (in: firmicutes) TaxID=185979 RepID=UPI0008EC80EC|nr:MULTISPECIES: YtxH domain-containing protein [unclassified Bacillus (in: firmicutes)]SFA79967.1 Gas vesicle protein [Bacillus sp. UNCCL13]SFQ70030.1 Gas vesicle protein [Bacillus sp. cl95]
MKPKQFIYGFLVGGVVAGVSTLLSTKSSGKETRASLIANKDLWSKHLLELKDNLVELKNSSVSASKEGKAHISQFVQDVNVSLAEWKSEIEPHQLELQKEIAQIEESIQQLETELAKNQSAQA